MNSSSSLECRGSFSLFLVLVAIAMLSMTAQHAIAQDLYVGSNSSGDSTNFNSGTHPFDATYIGYDASASNNQITVEGFGTLLSNSGDLYVGYAGSSNSMVVSNGGIVVSSNGWIGYSNSASDNSVLVSDSSALWTNSSVVVVGASATGGQNSLVISNGGTVISGTATGGDFGGMSGVIGGTGSASNTVLVSGQDSTWNLTGNLAVGFYGGTSGSNSLVISNGGKVIVSTADTALGTIIGQSTVGNSVLVTGSNSLWSNNCKLSIGYSAFGLPCSNNSLVIRDGGAVYSDGGVIGFAGVGDTVVITGTNSLWSNSSGLTIGGSSSDGTLTVANSGSLVALSILIASDTAGTLNIGSTNLTDRAGSIATPTIAFGSGTGTLNFNQSDTITLNCSISGVGTINQLGYGTTILSGSNNFTGTALISSGALYTSITNALGASDVALGGSTNTATLGLLTDLTISSLNWSSNSLISFTPGSQAITINGVFTSAGGGAFDFSGYTETGTNTLITFISSMGFTSADFSVVGGGTNWNFLLTSNTLSAYFVAPPDLYVGSNTPNNLTNFELGTTNTFSDAYVGYEASSSNNILTVQDSRTLLTNYGNLYVGYDGSGNTMVVSNGGTVANYWGYIGYGGSSNNSVLVTGSNSLWTSSGNLYVGYGGSSNSLTISNFGTVSSTITYIGNDESSSNNSVLVTGGGSFSSSSSIAVGYSGSGNSLTISDGGSVTSVITYIGANVTSSNNRVVVTGSGSLWTNSSDFYVGFDGSHNQLVISNVGNMAVLGDIYGMAIGYGSNSWNNSALVTGLGSVLTNDCNLNVGYSGSSNSLVISDNATVYSGTGYDDYGSGIGNGTGANGNTALITEAAKWISSDITGYYIGYGGSSNSLVINNAGSLDTVDAYIGAGGGSKNSVQVSGNNSYWTTTGYLSVGTEGSFNTMTVSNGAVVTSGIGIIGASSASSNNSVLVTGQATWISDTLTVGEEGSGNSLVIFGAGTVTSTDASIGVGSYASNNSVLVTGSNSLWSNSGNLVIGAGEAMGNSLIVTNGGQVQSAQITVTTGILKVGVTNGLGSSTVTLGGGGYTATLALSTNLTLTSPSDFDWRINGVIALAQGTHTLTLIGMTNSAGSNDGANVFQFLNAGLNNNTNVLINYRSLADFTTNSFSVQGITGYSFSTNNDQVSAYLSTNANVDVCKNITISNTLTVGSFTVGCASTTTDTPTGTLNASEYVLVTGNSTLIDNGLIVTPSLTVDQGSTLMGTGTLSLTGGNLNLNGTIAPGNSPGTFYVSGGNLVMGSSSVWDEQIYSSSVYDRVVVTGAAFLNGTMNITGYGSGGLQFGQKYNFLTASGGINGAFTSIVAPEGFRGRLLLSGTEANILMAPASYTQMAANQNQVNVAAALNSFIPYTSGDQFTVSTTLDSLTASQYNQAFNAIMPTFYQQIATVAFNQANALNMQLSQRLWGLRLAEGGGFTMSGLVDNYAMLQEGIGDGAGDGGKGVLDSKKDILRPGLDNHWGIFVDGNGIFAQANSGNMLPGYNSESGGVTTGLTYKWNKNVASGIYAGYQGTCTKSGANGSGLGTGSSLIDNAVRFGFFGTYGQENGKGLYANALAGGAYHNYQANRVIQFTGLNRTANSAPGAGELDTMLATGYDIQKGKFTYGPTASLQYTYLGVNSVNETGAQSLNFNSGGWNSSSMLSSLGAHAAYTWQANRNVVVVPQISLNWQHECMQNPYAINGNLGGTSPTFSNWSATGIRDYLYTGVGVTVEFSKKWNTSFFYNAAAGNSDLVSQNIFWSAGVKF